MSADTFAAKMEELRRSFDASLPARLAEMRRLLDLGADGRAELRSIAHKLSGQGGTFGYPTISAAAAAVEEAEPGDIPATLANLARAIEDR